MKTVLIVDDERVLLDALCAALEPWLGRIRVLTAGNGREAIHLLSREAVDLLLVDLMLPEVDGFQVVVYAKRHRPGTRVAVMSGLGPSRVRERVLDLDLYAYVEKPLDLGVMVGLIRSVLDEAPAMHPAGDGPEGAAKQRRTTRVLWAGRKSIPETTA